MEINKKQNRRKLYYRIIFIVIFIILVVVAIFLTQYRFKQNAYALGIEAVSGFSAKAEYTINAYHIAIEFSSTQVRNLITNNADIEKIFQWLIVFNNNLSKNVHNNATHSYIIIDNNFFCSSHRQSDMHKMPVKNIWYQEALKAEYDKIFFTSLYNDESTNEYVFTIYKKIKVDGKIVIIASDIVVNTLNKEWFKDTETIGNNIYILTDFKGDVVFTTGNTALVMHDQHYFYNIIAEIEKQNSRVGLIKNKLGVSQQYGLFYFYDKNNHFVSMVAVPLSEINGSVNSMYIYYSVIIVILALFLGFLYFKEKNSIDKINFSNDMINIIGSAYYLIFSINIKKDKYIRIKCSDDIKQYIPIEGRYSDINKLISMAVEKDTQFDFANSFSIENIRKLTESSKVDFGGDFQQVLTGSYKWINIRLLYDKSVQKDYAVLCFKDHDIEKKQELEHVELLEETIESMKAASVSKNIFYSGLSHDMRTPLNAIIGLTDLAKYNINDKIKINDYMDKIKSAGNHLNTLIDNFLDYSKNEFEQIDNEVVKFNLKEYLEENIAIFKVIAKNDNKKFIFKCDVKNNNLKGNTAKLYRIITNLLGNSIKYTEQGDTISLEVNEILNQGCPKYKFIISDTGIGMSEEFINKVCSPYQREKRFDTNKAGVGLGMAIVHNYVQYLNGDMQIESKINQGTKVTITLAFELADNYEKDIEDNNQLYDISGLSVLIVEDNNVNMYIVTELLSLHNVKITQAWNGQEAVDLFSKNPAGTFDVILMDLQMPVMGGIEAAKIIRELKRDDAKVIPIIALSANVYTEDVAASSKAGMNGHLAKPVNFDTLCKTIYNAVKNNVKNI